MAAMSESFVDLTYRGLALAARVKLAEVRPSTGYVEMPQPMPVGTAIAIATDDQIALEAVVIAIHEQVAGSERPPGMLLRPQLDDDARRAWWEQRVTLPEIEKPRPPRPAAQPPPLPPQVVVVGKRVTKPGLGVPELMDDGQDTGVMEAIDPDLLVPDVERAEESVPVVVDDGKKTTAMDAVDLAALGLDSASTSTSTTTSTSTSTSTSTTEDENGNGVGESGRRKKRKKR